MFARTRKSLGSILLAAILTLGAFAVLATAGGAQGPHTAIASLAASPATSSVASAAPSVSAVAPTTATSSNAASAMASAAFAAAHAQGIKPNVVLPPRPSATAQQLSVARQAGVVSPLYTGSPAPMGLAYYGLSAGPHGSVVGTVLNTTRLVATVNANATGIRAADLFQSSPDSYGIQLNAVVTNVTLFGTPGYSFWTQNVVEFYPDSGLLVLITNVWNFSGGALSSNVFYQHGPHGVQVGTTFYYAEVIVPFAVTYPFNLRLYLNSTLVNGRDSVHFATTLSSPTNPSENFAAPYDEVIFNSIAAGGAPLTQPANYTANGLSYNPLGLTDDYELIFGGPGGGSQSTLFAADATLGLGYWTGTHYAAVPSAYSYGGETGETVTGANIAWNDAPSGVPAPGITTYGTMTTGPSILTGLWNAGAPKGSYPVTLHVVPTNAFNVFSPATGWSSNLTVSELAVAPELETHTVYLIPGNYTLETELSDYAPVTRTLHVHGPVTVSYSLTPNRAYGVYTPLWAFSNAQVAALSSSGSGTPSSPYVIVNNQYGTIGSEFGLYNDYTFPVYPAVFFYGTSASTEFYQPPSFATSTNTFQYPGAYLPATNDLQYWFWNVTHLSVVGASNISGWFGATAYYPAVFDTFSVIFYEGGHNLVASNVFGSEGQGLLMFSGGSYFGALNVGGGNNTVWGNTFLEATAPSSTLALMPGASGLGLELAENNDLVYNNYFDTPTTAWLLPLNLYSGSPEFFTDAFNIHPQAASMVHYAAGFPLVPLTGSILGTTTQGGNFWWDYGLAFNPYNGANNPYGKLPYTEAASTLLVYIYGPSYYYASYLYPGGDNAPLLPYSIYLVTVAGVHLPNGLTWGAQITDSSGTLLDDLPASVAVYYVWLPSGSYNYTVSAPTGWSASSTGSFTVSGASTLVLIGFSVASGYVPLTFSETGLPSGTMWSVKVWGSSSALEWSAGSSLVFAVAAGTLHFYVQPVTGYTASPTYGSFLVASSPLSAAVTFT